MAEPAFTQAFLRRCVEIEKAASKAELELLDRTLASILDDPSLPGRRFPAFYDPQYPTFLVRAGPFLIEFAVNDDTDTVTFVSLFYRG
ncbi:MAG: hypothetical protein ACREQ2_28210 [Candidatus Binatia bacterium]